MADLSRFTISWPSDESHAERTAIGLERETATIDTAIAKAEQLIALASERRAAVITAAVTGRLDPRTGVERVEEMLEGAAL